MKIRTNDNRYQKIRNAHTRNESSKPKSVLLLMLLLMLLLL